jgi:hypothetical protein
MVKVQAHAIPPADLAVRPPASPLLGVEPCCGPLWGQTRMEPGKRILRCARTRPDWPLPGPAQMEVRLTIIGGKADRSEVRLQLPFFIGRSREADLTIAHPMVSRKHCEVFEFQGMVRVRDLGSLNGTTVLGQTVAESPLRPEDEFTVGPLTFRIDYDYGGDVTVEVASGNVAAAASPEQGQRTVDPGKTPTIPAPLRTAVWVPPANGPVEVTVAPVAAPGGHVAAPAPSEATPPGESPKGEALGRRRTSARGNRRPRRRLGESCRRWVAPPAKTCPPSRSCSISFRSRAIPRTFRYRCRHRRRQRGPPRRGLQTLNRGKRPPLRPLRRTTTSTTSSTACNKPR